MTISSSSGPPTWPTTGNREGGRWSGHPLRSIGWTYGQGGNDGGNAVPGALLLQQLSVPEKSHARSTAKIDGTLGSGLVPLPSELFDTMWFPSGNMSMSDGGGLHTDGGWPVQ